MPNLEEDGAVLTVVGKETPRVDGSLKVSGRADYASDRSFPGMLYAVPVGAAIASGSVTAIDDARARQGPGVRAIFKRGDLGPFRRIKPDMETMTYVDEQRPPLEDDVVRYFGQYIALVVADSFEEAKAAADMLAISYKSAPLNVNPRLAAEKTRTIHARGDAMAAYAHAPVTIDARYAIAPETHNPIEPHATVAVWQGDELTLYETSQGVVNHRNVVADILGVPRDKVRVVSKFVGSGFGGKLWPWSQSPLTAAAARKLGRPVKCVLSRAMMFHTVGHRPRIEQRVRLGAKRDGELTSILHDYVNATSILDDYEENCGEATPHMYSSPNVRVAAGLARRNVGTPTSMRGPGAVPGLFATESAMDELAIKLGVDPVDLRLKNEPALDEGLGLPFSSRHLKECLAFGAELFGWERRNPQVGSMTRDGATLGWGMAACSWIAERLDCAASVELRADGTVRVASASQDVGTGTYTVVAQMTAEELGAPLERVEVALGDTALPPGTLSGGSMLTASLVAPIREAIADVGRKLAAAAASQQKAPFDARSPADLRFEKGRLVKVGQNGRGVPFDKALQALGLASMSGEGSGKGTFGSRQRQFSSHSFGAHFVETEWRPDMARLGVSRVVSVIDAGRILNPLAARNQIQGSVVMGIGMALFESAEYDPANGAPMNASLADYLVATNADVPAIEVRFLEYPDYNLNSLGARGVGEIGLAGVAAAIANAVRHATGVRLRDLPIRVENLL